MVSLCTAVAAEEIVSVFIFSVSVFFFLFSCFFFRFSCFLFFVFVAAMELLKYLVLCRSTCVLTYLPEMCAEFMLLRACCTNSGQSVLLGVFLFHPSLNPSVLSDILFFYFFMKGTRRVRARDSFHARHPSPPCITPRTTCLSVVSF